jgi:hypothetical protein
VENSGDAELRKEEDIGRPRRDRERNKSQGDKGASDTVVGRHARRTKRHEGIIVLREERACVRE